MKFINNILYVLNRDLRNIVYIILMNLQENNRILNIQDLLIKDGIKKNKTKHIST